MKRFESVANGFFRLHIVAGERFLECVDVAPGAGLVQFDVKVHDRFHRRKGGHEQAYIALGALPKMIKNALHGRVRRRREQRPVKFAMAFLARRRLPAKPARPMKQRGFMTRTR